MSVPERAFRNNVPGCVPSLTRLAIAKPLASSATPIRHAFADQGFAGRLIDWSRDTLRTTLEIVRKPADQQGFAVHPRRWVVGRTLAWLTACRRLARDYERHPKVSESIIRWAAIAGTARRITRGQPPRRQPRRTFGWN